jgi:septum formation protein
MFDKTPLILASSSPRRRELLSNMGFEFEVVTSPAIELDHYSRGTHWNTGRELASKNALLKATAVSELRPDAFVIGADTIVELDGHIFGKPRDLSEARAFLAQLSGRVHQVITGVAILKAGQSQSAFCETTSVTFRSLTPQTIEDYTTRVHVLDKAGAYAAQDGGEIIIESIDGSRTNVIGLPTERLGLELKALFSRRSLAE